jgi:hypothetical protein
MNAGESFYFMASFSARGGDMPELYIFEPGQGDAQAAVDHMLKAKAAGVDGIVMITNNDTVFTGASRPHQS